MAHCDHVSWLELVKGNGGPVLSYGWRFAHVIQEMNTPDKQFPQLIFFIGKRQKIRHYVSCARANTILATNAMRSIYMQTETQCNPTILEFLQTGTPPSAAFYQQLTTRRSVTERKIFQSTASTSWQPHDLILARLTFLFCDVICIFADDVGEFAATVTLLMTWANIRSSSSLPRRIRPRVIIVTGNTSVTDKALNEDDLFFNLHGEENVSLFFSSFMDVKISNLPFNELSSDARYLQLDTELLFELHDARRIRESSGVMFSATHLNALFEDALQHTARDMLTPYNFIHASRKGNLLDGSIVSHLLMFTRQGIRAHVSYEAVASYIASAILMDAYPSSMH
ncbi:hypothetical protein ACJ72_08612, partial [Emergomyces africanus]